MNVVPLLLSLLEDAFVIFHFGCAVDIDIVCLRVPVARILESIGIENTVLVENKRSFFFVQHLFGRLLAVGNFEITSSLKVNRKGGFL